MSAPKVGQLWSTTNADNCSRFLRVSEVDTRFVSGYSWWNDSSSGRTTRIAVLMFTKPSSKWRLVEDAPVGAA